jgi:hypothetical protein
MVLAECAGAGSLQNLCDQVAGPALKKYLEQVDKEDSTQWCTEITMCTKKSRNFWENKSGDADCDSCLAFMGDLIAIAQYDPNHFAQIYDAITKGAYL